MSPPDLRLFNRLERLVHHDLEDLKTALDAAIGVIPAEEFRHAMKVSCPAQLRKCILS